MDFKTAYQELSCALSASWRQPLLLRAERSNALSRSMNSPNSPFGFKVKICLPLWLVILFERLGIFAKVLYKVRFLPEHRKGSFLGIGISDGMVDGSG